MKDFKILLNYRLSASHYLFLVFSLSMCLLFNVLGAAQRAAQATQDRVLFAERRCNFWKKKAYSENKNLVSVRNLVTTLRSENNRHIDCIKAFEKREQDGRYTAGVASIAMEEKLVTLLEEQKNVAEKMHKQSLHIEELEKQRMKDLQKVPTIYKKQSKKIIRFRSKYTKNIFRVCIFFIFRSCSLMRLCKRLCIHKVKNTTPPKCIKNYVN